MRSYNTARIRKDGSQPIQVIVRVPGCEESRSATYDTKEECDQFAARAERELRLRAGEVRSAGQLTQAELDRELLAKTFELFLRSKRANKRNKKHAKAIIKRIGNVRREGITISWVEDYIADMRDSLTYRGTPYSWDTIRDQLSLINKVLRWRAEQQRLTHVKVPFDVGTMFPKGWKGRRKRRFKTGEEEMLMNRLGRLRRLRTRPYWRLLVLFALETGARLQELLNATWSNVTWEQKHWFIPAGKTGERYVPLSLRAIELLRELEVMRHPESDRVFHELGAPDSVSALFRRYAKEAGLEDFRFHDLRHEAISRLVSNKRKMTMELIGLMVGHSSKEMTEHYAHLRGDEVAALLD